MTVREAAKRIGVSPSLIYALCQEGVIPHARHGRPGKRGSIRITEGAVEAYMAASKRAERQPAPLVLKHIIVR
ncbi:MAG: helix-turn-helix domain-containing protein [Planctomycetes bacterium]|nr:helix-turn-helix domain-containing protein [Planctomycetota bacterium]